MAGFPDGSASGRPKKTAARLVADLLEWHRREDKPKWWRWFHLLRLSDEELHR